MASNTYGVAKGETNLNIPTHTSPSKWKTYGFIIAIIAGIGALGLGGVGAFSYFHIGALSSIAQINAIIMMAVGGGCGIILLAVGIIGILKNRRAVSNQLTKDENSGHKNTSTTESKNTTNVSSDNTEEDWVYGPDQWLAVGENLQLGKLQILDTIPKAPKEKVAAGRMRIYIPKKISINDGEAIDLTLNNLRKMKPSLFWSCSDIILKQYGDETADGWIDIDMWVGYKSEKFDTQKLMVKEQGCRLPKILEAVVFNLMDFALSERRSYGDRTYTRCCEQISGGVAYTPIVGNFESHRGLNVLCGSSDIIYNEYGVAAVREFKSVSH